MIVLTDGADNASTGNLTGAIAAARAANAAIYTIGIEGAGFTPDPLQQLATSSGGQYYGASSSADLARVYRSIAAALTFQRAGPLGTCDIYRSDSQSMALRVFDDRCRMIEAHRLII